MMEFPSGSASVTWIAASSGFNGLSAPITRPEKGSVTSGILRLAGYSSGAKALRYCKSDPILTVAGTKGQFKAPPSNRNAIDKLE